MFSFSLAECIHFPEEVWSFFVAFSLPHTEANNCSMEAWRVSLCVQILVNKMDQMVFSTSHHKNVAHNFHFHNNLVYPNHCLSNYRVSLLLANLIYPYSNGTFCFPSPEWQNAVQDFHSQNNLAYPNHCLSN